MDRIKTGAFIAKCRKEKGITQEQLAEQLNITNKAVSKWETGNCLPDAGCRRKMNPTAQNTACCKP